jgi:hypothetical protein
VVELILLSLDREWFLATHKAAEAGDADAAQAVAALWDDQHAAGKELAAEAEAPPSNPFARIEASEAAEDPLGYRDRLLAADAARRQTLAEPAEASEAEVASGQPEAVEPEADPFPKGARVLARISKRRQALGTVDYRVDARHVRVHLTAAAARTPSSMFDVRSLVLATDEGWAAIAPAAKPERKPRAASSGDRKPSKSAELDAAAARGETPTKPVMTSKANPHYQKRFDQLEKWAMADDWNAIRGYEVKGINSYAKMVAAYRDRLLAAHEAQQSKTEAA